jgi:hypothetical protein
VNGVSLAGLTLSEVFDAFKYLVILHNQQMERHSTNPFAQPTVRMLIYDDWC